MKHPRTIPSDSDEYIERCPRNGVAPQPTSSIPKPEYNSQSLPQAFTHRVDSARVMLRRGDTFRDIRSLHGKIVLDQAMELEAVKSLAQVRRPPNAAGK